VRIALIDYGAGNLRSVANALRELGIDPLIVAEPDALEQATHVVLPGVGSFGDCMHKLSRRGLADALRGWLADQKPYLGICLGYQILFDSSEESPGVAGLGAVRGEVKRFEDRPRLKIPHMGWNSAVPSRPDADAWRGLGNEPYFYFVHSYFPVPEDDALVAARTGYGDQWFASAIGQANLLACQFHPEKSQTAGLRLMRQFLESNG
jgi:glutamine amidotransferase